MRSVLILFFLLLFSFCVSAQNQYDAEKCRYSIQQNKMAKCWDWIVLLETTKTVIEEKFGESLTVDKNKSEEKYKTQFGELTVYYTTGNDENTEECNCALKPGAAVSFSISPDPSVKVSNLGIDLTNFDKSVIAGRYKYYNDHNTGIWISTDTNRDGGEIVEFIGYSSHEYKKKQASVYHKKLSKYFEQLKPLKTDRRQIEKIFGQPKIKNCTECVYETPYAKIQVNYSTIPCKSSLKGWNVLPDTVLTVKIDPSRIFRFSYFDIGKEDYLEYIRPQYHSSETFRMHKLTEAIYRLSDFGNVHSIYLYPSEEDKNFRCSCYPPYNPLGRLYQVSPSEMYLMSDENDIQAKIDGAFLQATNQGKPFSVYLVVYLGKNDSQNRYNLFVEKAWKAWNYRSYPHEGLKIINGGRREKFEVDFFILARENPPPVPTPDNPAEYCQTSATN